MPLATPKRILCVSNRKALSPDFLKRLKKEVNLFYAAKAAEGYELAQRCQFDLFLFSDRLLTGSGIELYRKIRAFNVRTPGILLLTDICKSRAVKAREVQAQLVLSAPVNLEFLFHAIRELVAGAQDTNTSL